MAGEKSIEELRAEALGPEGLKNPQFTILGDPINPADPSVGISSDVDFTDAAYDVSRKARQTLGSYLSKKTAANSYKISEPIEGAGLARVNARGASLGVVSSDQKSFVATNSEEATVLKSSGLGIPKVNGQKLGTFFRPDQLESILDKTHQVPVKSGDDLLKKVPIEGVAQISSDTLPPLPVSADPNDLSQTKGVLMLQSIHQQLLDGNIYSPDGVNKFVKDPTAKKEEDALSRLFTIQRDLGYFKKDGKEVKVSDMSAMAMALIVRSAGNNVGSEYIINDKNLQLAGLTGLNPFVNIGVVGVGSANLKIGATGAATGRIADLAAAATGQQDFIQIQSDSNFATKRISPNNDGLPELQSTPGDKTSYGQLTTFLNPFGSRFSSVGMFTMAVASILVLIGTAFVFSVFAKDLTTTPSDSGAARDPKKPYQYKKGFYKEDQGLTNKIFEVTNTDYPFSNCVSLGLPLLFGFSGNSTAFTAALQSGDFKTVGINLLLSSGFYANFVRRIVVEGVEVVGSFGSVFSAGTNAVGAIDSLLKGIESITRSSTYRLIQVAAALGDIQLASVLGPIATPNTERFLEDQVVIDPAIRMSVNRWNTGQTKISNLSLRTFLAAQNSISDLGATIKGNKESFEKNSSRFRTPSRADVESYENALEAEYTPFYIHDLRNHEIISMPAFITDFTENFAANYAAVKGVGRQDPVRLYQDTERTMSLSFMLVAMNPTDFDHMWHTINRLIAMCYPQYSKGRERTAKKDDKTIKFIQPFSQVPAASPLVRLRLGDVFKSNYTKFGLRRLFGVGSESFSIQQQTSDPKIVKEYEAKIKQIENRVKESLSTNWKKITSDNSNQSLDSLKGIKVKISENDYCAVAPENLGTATFENALDIANSSVSQDKKDLKNIGTIKDKIPDEKNRVFTFVRAVGDKVDFFKKANILNINENSSSKEKKSSLYCLVNSLDGKSFIVNAASLVYYDDSYVDSSVKGDQEYISEKNRFNEKQEPYIGGNEIFLGADSNAVVRSFETTKGRGLAGFITSLGFSYDNMTWDTDTGRKAPKSVKISMGFVPINDLPLGLDYEGKIRNFSHPVGSLASSFGDPYDK